jgi:hypothetical protein
MSLDEKFAPVEILFMKGVTIFLKMAGLLDVRSPVLSSSLIQGRNWLRNDFGPSPKVVLDLFTSKERRIYNFILRKL